MNDQTPADQPEGDDLEFDHAEYTESPDAGPSCGVCHGALVDSYFQVNEQLVCPHCRTGIEAILTGGSGFVRFLRALLFGTLAGAAGAGIYYAVRALTGYELAIVAIVVGLFVGVAVRAGARSRGGWFYQTLAVLLTYSAIAATLVPDTVRMLREPDFEAAGAEAESAQTATDGTSGSDTSGEYAAADSDPASVDQVADGLNLPLLVLVPIAFILTFIFLIPGCIQSPILLLIYGFGLYEAWRINKRARLEIHGPYQVAALVEEAGYEDEAESDAARIDEQ